MLLCSTSCSLFLLHSFYCVFLVLFLFFFFSSRRRHTRCLSDWSSDVCSSDLIHAKKGRRPGWVGGARSSSAGSHPPDAEVGRASRRLSHFPRFRSSRRHPDRKSVV